MPAVRVSSLLKRRRVGEPGAFPKLGASDGDGSVGRRRRARGHGVAASAWPGRRALRFALREWARRGDQSWVDALWRGLAMRPGWEARRREEASREKSDGPTPAEEAANLNAAAFLVSFGSVRSPSGEEGCLSPKEVGGGGWCFFRAIYDQFGSGVIPSFEYLAVLTLASLASRSAEFSHLVPGVDFLGQEERAVSDARSFLRDVPAYRTRGVVGRLSPFQCLVLDKFEGVLAGDLLDLRRYPDVTDARVFLQLATCEVVVFEGNDLDRGDAGWHSRVYPSCDPVDAGALRRLAAGDLDMVLVRYERLGYEHYKSVAFEDGRAWRVSLAKRCVLEQRYLTCDVCRAVRARDDDLARMLMYTRLSGNDAPDAVTELC